MYATELADMLAPHVEAARVAAKPVIADAKLRAADARERSAPLLADARLRAAPLIADARVKAGPVIADARDKAAPVIIDAKDRFTTEVLPVLTAAVAAAAEATEEMREEARRRGLATAAALRGEVEPPKPSSHKLRNVVGAAGVAGVFAVIAKALSDRQASTAWKSSYQPSTSPSGAAGTGSMPTAGDSSNGSGFGSPVPPSPTTLSDPTPTATAAAAAAGAPVTDDVSGSGPDEAASDATDVPHAATTPESPVEEVRVEGDKDGL